MNDLDVLFALPAFIGLSSTLFRIRAIHVVLLAVAIQVLFLVTVFAPNALPCPRHHRKHTFNLVDFGMTERIPLDDKERQYVEEAMLYEGLEDTAFWGII